MERDIKSIVKDIAAYIRVELKTHRTSGFNVTVASREFKEHYVEFKFKVYYA